MLHLLILPVVLRVLLVSMQAWALQLVVFLVLLALFRPLDLR